MRYFKIQLSLLFRRTSFIATFTLMCVYAIAAFFLNCINNFGKDVFAVPAAKYLFLGSNISNVMFYFIPLIFAVVAAIPFADTFFEERSRRTTEFCLVRCTDNQYYFSKLFAVFFSGFIVMFIPLIINYFLNFIAFPIESTVDYTNLPTSESGIYTTGIDTLVLFKEFFAKNMYIYNILHLFLISLTSGFISVVVFQFSFFYKKSRVMLICSFFIIYHIYTIILTAFGAREFCINNYIFASMVFEGQTIRGLFVVFIVLVLAAFLPIPFAKRKLRKIYD
ncbi:MAG: hypothetical protein IJC79_05460 [Clostridia bacterium]|nr:hypothetical protein [Clostridia bacterium]